MVIFASGTSLLRHTSTSWHGWLRRYGGSVLVLVRDLGSRDGNCIGLLANTGLFLSTGKKNLFLLQRRLVPCDF